MRQPALVRGAILGALLLLSGCAASPSLPDPLTAGWNGKPVCEVLHEDDAQRVLRCTFPPGVGHERHFHPRHFGYALSGGRMRIVDARGTREVDLPTGSSFASDGVEWHEVLNVGTTTVSYLIVEPR
ncbi:MAG: cupin domain-containing protein [Pseudomonadota bacterium]